ncbi:MAG TPA: superoxide dismutase, Ni [Candidatus Nanoarchaeia archaeon]
MKFFTGLFQPKVAYAHCDVPCGIYDPHNAQMAAHTVLRMTKMIEDLKNEDEKKFVHQLSRLQKVKEEHAELLKSEVRIIWGDYFKAENYQDLPLLHEKVFKIMKLASKVRQEVNLEACNELMSATLEFAEIFYKSKGLEPVRVKSPYPTEGELVIYK